MEDQNTVPAPVKAKKQKKFECGLCHKTKEVKSLIHVDIIRPSLQSAIATLHPKWEPTGYICRADFNHVKNEYIQGLLKEDRGHLSHLERAVVKSMKEHEILSENINQQFDRELTFGEKIADKVATFGGSWRFIISFGVFILIWVILNGLILLQDPFDPFPFILLNLFLSCLAALQAPVIMMSQNRQEDKDRLRSEYDYKINLKAELEIRHLNEKMDHLLQYQWQRLLEIQELQLDLIEDMAKKKKK